MSDMKDIEPPDAITKAACGWLLSGGVPGAYAGPDPGAAHDLSPLLAGEMKRNDISLSRAAVWFRQEQIIRPVLESISGEGAEVWAVKGFDLARSVYPFPGGRPMCDADLFIEERNRQKILGIFSRSGWSRGSPGDGIFNSGIVSEMKMYRHGAMVELHTHIFYFPATFPGKLPTDLFENGRLLEPGLMGFAWHNALLMVLLHTLTNIRLRPVWWVDICLLCGKVSEAGSWNKFARNAFATKLGSSLAYLLRTASAELEAPVPERVMIALNRSNSGREDIIEKLKAGRKLPTLLNLKHLRGWKKVSWFYALLWLVLTGQHPLRRK
ncbi:MAG: hypothetical protein GQ565_11365 [Candidatus Aegiribacteria sp.]|nr:hypothetical protein [Candidatus Aegiribacteria sp.]